MQTSDLKTCNICGETKPSDEFYINRRQCKVCQSKQSKLRYLANRKRVLRRTAIYREEHREENKKYFRDRYRKEKNEILKKQKEYAAKHREERKEYLKKYYIRNRERLRIQAKQRQRERLKNDNIYKLKRQTRLMIWRSFNCKGKKKNNHAEDVLGCTLDEFIVHLKRTWLDKYKKEWKGQPCHIDHIIPLATAKTEEDVIKLCHYKNLRLLTPIDNIEKRDKIIELTKKGG